MKTNNLRARRKEKVKKILFLIILLLLFACKQEQESSGIYSIDGYFKAYFPGKPELYKEYENASGRFVFYQYQDFFSNIQFVANYTILNKKPEDNQLLLYRIINSVAKQWNGSVLKYEAIKHNGNDEVHYISKTIKNDELIYEVGLVTIKDSLWLQWVIEQIDDKNDAQKIFNETVKYFRVLK